jgi:hypothetical protein
MKRDEVEELLSCLEILVGLCEDLTQKVVAMEAAFQLKENPQYQAELKKLKEHGGITNAVTALEALCRKILPD